MSNRIIPGFVYTDDLIKQAMATEKFVDGQWRRSRRSNIGWRIYALMMTIMVFMLGGALNYAIPLVRLVPVFFYQKPDGVLETALTTAFSSQRRTTMRPPIAANFHERITTRRLDARSHRR